MSQNTPSLRELEHHSAFVERHIGPNDAEIAQMLDVVGHASLDGMTDAIVPAKIKSPVPLALPESMTEVQALAKIRAIADKNTVLRSFIGQGYYGTHTPNVILRNILENPAWYTAYTPYQAEISQGRMEALINFQTLCADLTGMEIANASLLDEATAAAEAMTLAKRSAKSKSDTFFVHDAVHPQTLELLRTRAEPMGIVLRVGTPAEALEAEAFGLLLQYPDTFGQVGDYKALVDAVHARGGLVAVATDLLALTLLAAPGEWGADIVVGNSQRFGVPFGFGGPHAAFMACRDAYKRSMPGRLIGVSIDAQGNPAYRLTLQTREQHIRREKATSNICHRTGAAGGDGLDVCRLPRPGRPDPHRPPHPSPGRHPGQRAAHCRCAGRCRLLRHAARHRCRRRRDPCQGPCRRLQPACDRQQFGRHQPGRDRHPRRHRRRRRAVRCHR